MDSEDVLIIKPIRQTVVHQINTTCGIVFVFFVHFTNKSKTIVLRVFRNKRTIELLNQEPTSVEKIIIIYLMLN